MKKLITAAFSLLATTAFAGTQNSQNISNAQFQPMAAIQVFDTSGTQPRLMKGNKLSRSKSRQVCVTLVNLPTQEKNLFAEYFQAPAPMNLTLEGANVQVEENRKNFLISFHVPKSEVKSNTFSQCWQFNKQNPIGTYKLDVQFNGVVFKGLEFKVLK